MSFTIHTTHNRARTGTISTPSGDIQTPAFTVVGTKATVKALPIPLLAETKTQAVLANTYHLFLQPGHETVAKAGGLARFMGWDGPTFTDSGGFQVFSLGAAFGNHVSKIASGPVVEKEAPLPSKRKCIIDEDGVTFTSHISGTRHRLTPERSMEIQHALGADVIFAFDECTSPRASKKYQHEAMERTHRWAERSLARHEELDAEKKQQLFAVVQGGRFEDFRRESARTLATMQDPSTGSMFDGFGIGGSFTKEDLAEAVGWATSELPEEKPRHLLGIGHVGDIFAGVEQGCDTFDCVSPSRIARNGTLHTEAGDVHVRNARYRNDHTPIDPTGQSPIAHYTWAYLSHLFRAKEMLGPVLATQHNVWFIVSLLGRIRHTLADGTYETYKKEFLKHYYSK